MRKTMSDTLIFIPSFDRPMQLDATLRSLFKYCEGALNCEICVLYKTSNERFEISYETLKKEHPKVIFEKEYDFKSQLLKILSNKMYVLFVVDDNLFVKPFNIELCKEVVWLGKATLIGMSLRLGENTTVCYPLKKDNKMPKMMEVMNYKQLYVADWLNAGEGDFSYPLELSSSLYEVNKIQLLLEKCEYANPNGLEWCLYCNRMMLKDYRYLIFYKKSVAFCNPVNKVQNTNSNRTGNNNLYSTESLLDDFEKGYRIDISAYDEFTSNGCHQEISLVYEEKNEQR